jgi:hypothetical protein
MGLREDRKIGTSAAEEDAENARNQLAGAKALSHFPAACDRS